MHEVIQIVTPVFGLSLIGYLAARTGMFPETAASGLARFVFDYAMPLMLIRTFAAAQLPQQLPWDLLGSYYLPTFALYAMGMLIGAVVFKQDPDRRIITGFGCAFGNNVLLGLPLVMLTFGEEGALPFFIILSVHGLSLFTLTTLLLEYGRHGGGSGVTVALNTIKGLLKNPILAGLAVGLTLNRTGMHLPQPIDQIALYMQNAVAACALFSLGAALSRYHIAGQLRQSLFILSMKNLLMPALVWILATRVFGLEPLWAMVATLMAAQPSGVNTYLFAERYRAACALATTTVFLSTTFSVVSISVILYLYLHQFVVS